MVVLEKEYVRVGKGERGLFPKVPGDSAAAPLLHHLLLE